MQRNDWQLKFIDREFEEVSQKVFLSVMEFTRNLDYAEWTFINYILMIPFEILTNTCADIQICL